jgi:membrane protease YdiL (CAAX protease family)
MDEDDGDASEREGARPPLWKRILDFPLVSLLIAFAAVTASAGVVAGLFERGFPPSPAVALVAQIAVVAVMIGAYKLIVRRLGERKHDDLAGPGAFRELGAGLLLGASLFALIVVVVALAGVYRIVGWGGTGDLVPSVIGDGLFPAVAEELIFRAIIFRWVEELAGSWVALIVSSVLFGLSHTANPNADLVSTVGIMLEGGILLGAAYMATRRLWLAMGIHASWNVAQGEVFDIPVSGMDSNGLVEARLQGPALLSGGGFGLEASLICIAIATAAGILLVIHAVRRGQKVPTGWLPLRRLSRPYPPS